MKIKKLARQSGVLSTSEMRSYGIHPEYLRRMCAEGTLVREGRGLYSLSNADITIHHGLVLASKAVPKGVICLLSALRFYEIGTENPREIWMALDRRAARPRIKFPKTRIVRFSAGALTEGVKEYVIEGVRVRIYSPSKTVADCFKYRNKIGLDVSLEALREGLRSQKCTVEDLWNYAKICRVTNVMRPYMEAFV